MNSTIGDPDSIIHSNLAFPNISGLSENYVAMLDAGNTVSRADNRVEYIASLLPTSEPLRLVIARWYLAIRKMKVKKLFFPVFEELGLGLDYRDETSKLKALQQDLFDVPGLMFSDDLSVAPLINPFDDDNLQKKEKKAAKVKASAIENLSALATETPIVVPRYALLELTSQVDITRQVSFHRITKTSSG
jgi:hypothetical protein